MGTSEKLAKNIKKLLETQGVTPSQLAKASGIDKPIISRILSGKTTNPQVETLKPIAEFFGVSIDQLIGSSPLLNECTTGMVVPVKRLLVPLIDWKNVNYWHEIKDSFSPKETFEVTSHISINSFALRIMNSKFEPKIAKDTIIIVDPDAKPENREYVIVEDTEKIPNDIHNNLTLKQLVINENKRFLKSVGSNFEMLSTNNQQKFFGVIVEAFIKLESDIS